MAAGANRVAEALQKNEKDILASWAAELKAQGGDRRITDDELSAQTREFLKLLQEAAQGGNVTNVDRPEWDGVRHFLDGVSSTRAAALHKELSSLG